MKVGFFTSMVGAGSVEVYLRGLILGCRERGVEPVLFGLGGSWLMSELAAQGITCVPWREATPWDGGAPAPSVPAPAAARAPTRSRGGLKQRVLGRAPTSLKLLLGNLKDVVRLYRVFGRHRVDAMQINVHGYEVAGIACRWRGIPCLGLYQISPTEESAAIRRWLIRWTARSYHLLVGVSASCARAWRLLCGLPEQRCTHVYNSTDVKRYAGIERGGRRNAGQPFKLLIVAKLHPMKGHTYLVSALGHLRDRNVELIVAGQGDLERDFRAQAEALGVLDRIRFLGHVADPLPLYREADCFVMPSVALEGFSFAVVEAMASGLPVITSDFGPLVEANVHEVTGLVVPAANPEAIAAAVRRLMDSDDERRRFGEAARARACAEFSADTMTDRMVALYTRLAAC